MKRVLIAHPSAEVYGSDRQLLESIEGLADAGWEVLLHLPVDGPLVALAGRATVTVRPFPVLRKALLRVFPLLALLLRTPLVVKRLVGIIRAADVDLVYVNTVTIPWWVVAARLARTPSLIHVHEAEDNVPDVVSRGLNAPLLLARAVIANSVASRRVVVDAIPALAERVQVVPNGLADRGCSPSVRGNAVRIALVARLSPRKGVDVALESVALLRAEGKDVRIDVCGSTFAGYEWFEDRLRERADLSDLRGAVTFHGWVSSTAPVLAAADVVLVPSRVEPFGNTAVEGMFAGRPVIASAVQGLAEIIEHGVTGLLVPPADAVALAAAIQLLIDDPALAQRLASAGRAAAQANFSVDRYRRDIANATAAAVNG